MGYATGYKTPSPDAVSVEVSGSNIHSEQVLQWREREFKRMGFVDFVADFLASTRIDLHQMESLLKAGCEHRTAAEILMGTSTFGEDENWILTDEADYFMRDDDTAAA